MPKTVIVVPCFNEAVRWNKALFHQLLSDPAFMLMLVDDKSHDHTLQLMSDLESEMPDRIRVLALPTNKGKAEAVRQGLIAAMEKDVSIVGYADADFATPPDEIHRLAACLNEAPGTVVGVLGSRIRTLGRWIDRRPMRHYLGRIFATWASILLRLPIYDTQCGAKLFRAPSLQAALRRPFRGRWTFDVELIHRLCPPDAIDWNKNTSPLLEIPLERWHDQAGSKLSWTSFPSLMLEIVQLWWHLRKQ